MLVFLCNILWFVSMLPRWLAFRLCMLCPEIAQKRCLKKILRISKLADVEDFARLPLRDYEEFEKYIKQIMAGNITTLSSQAPILLEPTGGSTGGTKFIPYNKALKNEFKNAISPWLVELFCKHPGLFFGKQYWSITPATKTSVKSAIPVGFEDDAEYLGGLQAFLCRQLFAIPQAIKECNDYETVEYLTIIHLLKEKNLRLISVWHPSFLTVLLSRVKENFDEYLESLKTGEMPEKHSGFIDFSPCPERAEELQAIGFLPQKIWPKLKVISCWGGKSQTLWLDKIAKYFPMTLFQHKGLISTEGISSIPLANGKQVLAVNSHYYEFEEPSTSKLLPLHKIRVGQTYHLVLSSGNGLLRYKTHDLVKITGFCGKVPTLEFLTRNNSTSDLFGEKISLAQSEEICAKIPVPYTFTQIRPVNQGEAWHYVLFIETESKEDISDYLENALSQNFHYKHARQAGQLQKAQISYIKNAEEEIRKSYLSGEQQAGKVKIQTLSN